MPSAWTDVKISSLASLMLGGRSFSGFTENSEASLCEQVYPLVKRTILGSYNWHFARKKAQITREATAPQNEWTYQFVLPPDRLENGVVKAFRSDDTPYHFKDFEVVGNRIMSDQSEIHVEYIYDISESNMPDWFVMLLVKALMVEICIPIKRSADERTKLYQEVYGEGGEFEKARRADTRNTPNPVMQEFPVFDSRFA